MTLIDMILSFLEENPNQRFTTREIARGLVKKHEDYYIEKWKNSIQSFKTLDDFTSVQVAAEISSQKASLLKKEANFFVQAKPIPMVFWYDPLNKRKDLPTPSLAKKIVYKERDLYLILVSFLRSELGLYCKRIDERRSKNSKGSGGNHWLYPDVVAMQPIDKDWNELVRNCVRQGTGQRVKLWSFEVKKELTGGNVRKCFFQAVSNSSWANEGYLVAMSISNNDVEQELRMLSSLHGIGVIILNPRDLEESKILLPAKAKQSVDWQSVNRILVENNDFKDFTELVSTYYQTGRIRLHDWENLLAINQQQ